LRIRDLWLAAIRFEFYEPHLRRDARNRRVGSIPIADENAWTSRAAKLNLHDPAP
jgi:hypothetical protein